MKEIHDDDVQQVLTDDGIPSIVLKTYDNRPTLSLDEIKEKMGEGSWAVRVIYNAHFGGFFIKQHPGEGNREHYHPDADESWMILEGEWEWYMEGEGLKRVKAMDIVVVQAGTKHQIKCVGDKPGIRLAITRPDVNHVYTTKE